MHIPTMPVWCRTRLVAKSIVLTLIIGIVRRASQLDLPPYTTSQVLFDCMHSLVRSDKLLIFG